MFIRLLVGGHLGCLYLGWWWCYSVYAQTIMHTCVFLFPGSIYLEVILLSHVLILCLILWRTIAVFAKLVTAVYITTSNIQGFQLFRILPTFSEDNWPLVLASSTSSESTNRRLKLFFRLFILCIYILFLEIPCLSKNNYIYKTLIFC